MCAMGMVDLLQTCWFPSHEKHIKVQQVYITTVTTAAHWHTLVFLFLLHCWHDSDGAQLNILQRWSLIRQPLCTWIILWYSVLLLKYPKQAGLCSHCCKYISFPAVFPIWDFDEINHEEKKRPLKIPHFYFMHSNLHMGFKETSRTPLWWLCLAGDGKK